MSRIVKMKCERTTNIVRKYYREFRNVKSDAPVGYSFPCFPSGQVNTDDDNYASWKANYEYCIGHPDEVTDLGVRPYEYPETEPAVGLCSCGKEIWLVPNMQGTCRCPGCGQIYNMFGQPLTEVEDWQD